MRRGCARFPQTLICNTADKSVQYHLLRNYDLIIITISGILERTKGNYYAITIWHTR